MRQNGMADRSRQTRTSPTVTKRSLTTVNDDLGDTEFEEHNEADPGYPNPLVAQELIDSGMAWVLEGSNWQDSIAHACMVLIRDGHCTFGPEPHFDGHGNRVPAMRDLKPGTMGTPEFVAARAAARDRKRDA